MSGEHRRIFTTEYTEFHGNQITAPRQGALNDKYGTLPRTIKTTVYINVGWIYPAERAAEE